MTTDLQKLVLAELLQARDLLDTFLGNSDLIDHVVNAGSLVARALRSGNKVLTCGNGGSMSDAMHLAEELAGKFRNDRIPLPAIAISDPSYLTCAANDYGYEQVFSRFIEAHGQKGDVLVVLTTSGNSANVIRALNVANQRDMISIALTGNDGGQCASLADLEIRVPHIGFADRIQEMHIKIIHILILLVERDL